QKTILEKYMAVYNENDDKDQWFGRMKEICPEIGFASEVKEFKAAEPGTYKGHVGDVSSVVRVAVTGRKNTPDLRSIMALMGREKCEARIRNYIETL
ncbi:MAG: glutamate--tRNA ligase, partial [Clostridia bacterium]|nr:glutamate--tRNA ligase [Clostridia bacterium]